MLEIAEGQFPVRTPQTVTEVDPQRRAAKRVPTPSVLARELLPAPCSRSSSKARACSSRSGSGRRSTCRMSESLASRHGLHQASRAVIGGSHPGVLWPPPAGTRQPLVGVPLVGISQGHLLERHTVKPLGPPDVQVAIHYRTRVEVAVPTLRSAGPAPWREPRDPRQHGVFFF